MSLSPGLRPPLPDALRELSLLDYDYAEGDGIDFEPFEAFLPPEETRDWIQAWTGNPDQDGQAYLPFGSDGTGGLAVLWLAHEGASLLDQPVVFFGSEGELGLVARSVYDYLWVLAAGYGPAEALRPDRTREPNSQFLKVALAHARRHRRPVQSVLDDARRAHPDFVGDVEALCR